MRTVYLRRLEGQEDKSWAQVAAAIVYNPPDEAQCTRHIVTALADAVLAAAPAETERPAAAAIAASGRRPGSSEQIAGASTGEAGPPMPVRSRLSGREGARTNRRQGRHNERRARAWIQNRCVVRLPRVLPGEPSNTCVPSPRALVRVEADQVPRCPCSTTRSHYGRLSAAHLAQTP